MSMHIIAGKVQADGTPIGSGFDSQIITYGVYSISFDEEFDSPPSVVATPSYDATPAPTYIRAATVDSTEGQCTVWIFRHMGSIECSFNFIAIGSIPDS
jgi:hypothetical protein